VIKWKPRVRIWILKNRFYPEADIREDIKKPPNTCGEEGLSL
jgi:hypothetical protein